MQAVLVEALCVNFGKYRNNLLIHGYPAIQANLN